MDIRMDPETVVKRKETGSGETQAFLGIITDIISKLQIIVTKAKYLNFKNL